MVLFPDGRPEHLTPPPSSHGVVHTTSPPRIPVETGESQQSPEPESDTCSQVREDTDSDDCYSGNLVKKRKVHRPKDICRQPSVVLPWIEHEVVRGWASVFRILKLFSQQCDCCPLVRRYGENCSYCVTYRLECAYTNRMQCK